jgi:hypothetical protein
MLIVDTHRGKDKGHCRSQILQDSLAGDVLRVVRLLLTCLCTVQNGPGDQQHQLEKSLCFERHDSTAIIAYSLLNTFDQIEVSAGRIPQEGLHSDLQIQ